MKNQRTQIMRKYVVLIFSMYVSVISAQDAAKEKDYSKVDKVVVTNGDLTNLNHFLHVEGFQIIRYEYVNCDGVDKKEKEKIFWFLKYKE